LVAVAVEGRGNSRCEKSLVRTHRGGVEEPLARDELASLPRAVVSEEPPEASVVVDRVPREKASASPYAAASGPVAEKTGPGACGARAVSAETGPGTPSRAPRAVAPARQSERSMTYPPGDPAILPRAGDREAALRARSSCSPARAKLRYPRGQGADDHARVGSTLGVPLDAR
jgi:hypothetical protein